MTRSPPETPNTENIHLEPCGKDWKETTLTEGKRFLAAYRTRSPESIKSWTRTVKMTTSISSLIPERGSESRTGGSMPKPTRYLSKAISTISSNIRFLSVSGMKQPAHGDFQPLKTGFRLRTWTKKEILEEKSKFPAADTIPTMRILR